MISLRFLLGLIPKTAEIEQKEASLIKEHEELLQYTDSDELKRYHELKVFVNNPNFKTRKKEIESQSFKNTKEFKEYSRYLNLKKSSGAKNYFKILNSHELAEYLEMEKSGEYADASALDKTILKSPRYKAYNKFGNSPSYKSFLSFQQSELKTLQELEAYINSEKFKSVKDYMELPSKEKWMRSDEYKKYDEYTQLANSDKLKWYFEVKDSKKFDDIKRWNKSFEDNFETSVLDKTKWLTRYYWGDAIMNESYSLTTDLQAVTDGKNIEIKDSILSIVTKKEKITGKSWDPLRGFFPREFDYSSGLISTGKSVRQQYGRIQAKIRINASQNISHTFSLMALRITPQIDILKYESGKFMMNYFWGTDKTQRKSLRWSAAKIENDYFIYEIEWDANKIVWKINGLTMHSQVSSLPNEPMYLFMSSALYNEPAASNLPSSLDVDWVRWYQKA